MFGVKYLENPWREKFDFFLKNPMFPYLDVYKNGRRGLNNFGEKKSFRPLCKLQPKQYQGRYCIAISSIILTFIFFFNTIFVSSHIYPENPKGTQVIVGSMNMGYISDTARNRTHNLFSPKRESIPLGHSFFHPK